MEGGRQSARVCGETLSDSWGPATPPPHAADRAGAAHNAHTHKKKPVERPALQRPGCHVWRWPGAAWCAHRTPSVNRSHLQVHFTVQKQSLVFTIVWDGACVSQRQQHVQHGDSIRELVQTVDVLVDGAQQLTYHPARREVNPERLGQT